MKQANNTRPWRSPSFNEESSPRSMTPVSDYYLHKRVDNVENYINKFDDRLSTLDVGAKSFQNESSFISQPQKKITENSRLDGEYRIRAIEDNLLHSKAETSKRIDFLEGQIQELSRRISSGGNVKQEDSVKVSGIERRIDVIEKQLSSLTSNFEAFMRKFEIQQQVQQQSSSSHWERSESIKDLRTPETNKNGRYGGVPKSSETDYQHPKRTQSRDTRDVSDYDNFRQSSDAKKTISEFDRQENGSITKSSIGVDYQASKRPQSRDTYDYSDLRKNSANKERQQDPIQHQQRSVSEVDRQERSQGLEANVGLTKSSIVEYQPPKRTQSHDYNDLRKSSATKERQQETRPQSSTIEYQPPQRTQSRDYENLRQTSAAKDRQEDPIQNQQRSISELDRQERSQSSTIDYQPPKRTQSRETRDQDNVRDNLRQNFDGKSKTQDLQDRSQRLEDKINLEVKVAKNPLKSGLKSPDSARRRKSVSWSEECTPQGKGEVESGQKRKRQGFNDEAELSQLLETEEKEEHSRSLIQERERPRTAIKERIQQAEKGFDVSYSRSENSQKGERFGKFSEVLIEEGNEEGIIGQRNNSSKLTNDREYTDGKSITDMEERRRKIDEEIERRITKQIEFKKRNEVAIEGQKKVYEKTAQVDEDFKISPFSTEKSRDKEVVARLVREKQMRSELISKYSDSALENSRKSKSPISKR